MSNRFLKIIFIEIKYNLLRGKQCDKITGSPYYTTFSEVQDACSSNSDCNFIRDYGCSHVKYAMCSGALQPSNGGSCIWSTGMIYSYAPQFAWPIKVSYNE